MKNIIAIIFLFFCLKGEGQITTMDSVYVYNQKTDKLKKCLLVYTTPHIVEFRITETSVKTFIKIDTKTWTTFNKKVVTREEKEGWVIFYDSDKVYLYKTN